MDQTPRGVGQPRLGECGRWSVVYNGESPDDVVLVTSEIAARVLISGAEAFIVQAADLPTAGAALAAVQSAARFGSPVE